MILPYTHELAMAQYPVSFIHNGTKMRVYPLTLRSILDMTTAIRESASEKRMEGVGLLPEDARVAFMAEVMTDCGNMSFREGDGRQYCLSDLPLMVRLIGHYNRHASDWPESRIESVYFPNGLTDAAATAVYNMGMAVHRDLPTCPKPKITEKRLKYESTDDENIARYYRLLIEKYHWTMDTILDLTDYQISWFTYILPEERERMEEMDELTHKNDHNRSDGLPDVPYQSNTMHFSSPAEYEAWLALHPEIAQNQAKPAPKQDSDHGEILI